MGEVKTLATLVLGGAWDATEFGENDIQPDSKLIEELQQRLVTGFDDVYIQLIDRADFDRVAAENQALQQRLTLTAQRIDAQAQKYDDTLLPFVALMRRELHANAGKGDRPGWLAMSSDTCLLEIIYHFGKLQASVKRGDGDGMAEYAADVANMCMMLLDICGAINPTTENPQ
jgi:hypothetical protein